MDALNRRVLTTLVDEMRAAADEHDAQADAYHGQYAALTEKRDAHREAARFLRHTAEKVEDAHNG